MTKVSSLAPYEIEVVVPPSDIDEMGHVNNVVYLRWVQDIATAHWRASATEAQQARLLWVVAKHEIEYKRPALEADTLIIRTWVGKAARRLFARHTEIRRKNDGKLVARALSHWAPIDAATKQAIKATPDVYTMFST